MIERSDLLRRTGLSAKQLDYLRTLRLVRVQERGNAPGWGGSKSYYPDEALAKIEAIQTLQGQGMSLAEIADIMRGSKVAVATGGEFPGGVKEAEPSNPDDVAALFRLMDRLKREFGAERIISIRFEYEERDGQRIVRAPAVVYR